MPLSRRFWERRADRLFKEWDSIEDPYGLPLEDFQRADAKCREASTIALLLETMDNEIAKVKATA